MKMLLCLLAVSLTLAFLSEKYFPKNRIGENGTRRVRLNLFFIAMVVILGFACGLRTSYNDTTAYINGFRNAPLPMEYIKGQPNLLGNPAYYIFQSFFRHHLSDNYHVYFTVVALFCMASFLRFLRRYSENFIFSVLMFFCLGLYVFCFAAPKQCIGMALLTYSVPLLLKRKWVGFYLVVLLAALFHTYALVFVILPLFLQKPWTAVTYLTVAATLLVLFTFEETITVFLDRAEDFGKHIAEEEVFDNQSINIFRVAVFSVPPVIAFVFRRRLWPLMEPRHCLMINMSILSLLVMSLGLVSAANLFGRCAYYFEIGAMVALPWMLDKLFSHRAVKYVSALAAVCYLGFFLYDIRGFSEAHTGIGLIEFVKTLF